MVHFTCQLGWAIGPMYVVKQYSGCFYKGDLDYIFISGIGVKQMAPHNMGGPHPIS